MAQSSRIAGISLIILGAIVGAWAGFDYMSASAAVRAAKDRVTTVSEDGEAVAEEFHKSLMALNSTPRTSPDFQARESDHAKAARNLDSASYAVDSAVTRLSRIAKQADDAKTLIYLRLIIATLLLVGGLLVIFLSPEKARK